MKKITFSLLITMLFSFNLYSSCVCGACAMCSEILPRLERILPEVKTQIDQEQIRFVNDFLDEFARKIAFLGDIETRYSKALQDISNMEIKNLIDEREKVFYFHILNSLTDIEKRLNLIEQDIKGVL